MGAAERRKGQRGENELYQVLADQLGTCVRRRDLSQARDGGGDIQIPEAAIVVESKYTRRRSTPSWVRQARESARALGPHWIGVAAWREHGVRRWRFFLPCPSKPFYFEVDLQCFCDWVRGRLSGLWLAPDDMGGLRAALEEVTSE